MEVMNQISLRIIVAALIFWPMRATSQAVESTAERVPVWYVSFQYLGLTYHPGGGNTPERMRHCHCLNNHNHSTKES
jgi:hypothetical protein